MAYTAAKVRHVSLVLIGLLVTLVALAGSPMTAETAPAATTVVLAVDPDWRTTDPANAYERHGQLILRVIYDPLVRLADGKIQPWLAESWTVSGDGKEYTFTLRQGARFTSGNPVTSADVAFSFMRLKHVRGNPAFLAANIKTVETPDARTAKVILEEPEGAFLSKVAQSPFSVTDSQVIRAQGGSDAPNAREVDKAKEWLERNSAGSGPFVLRKWAPREETILERNPRHWGKQPSINRIILKEIKDSNAQSLQLQRGDVDIALALTADQLSQLRSAQGIKIVNGNTLNIYFLLMNQDPQVGGPFANERVRRAVRAAIDYQGLRTLFGLNAVSPFNIIPKGFVGALDTNVRKTDLDRAKRMLSEAGYPNGIDAKMEVSNFTVTGVHLPTAAEKIQQDLAKVGIRVTLEPSELAVGLPRYRGGQQGLSLWMWGPDYADPANQLAFLPGEKVGLRANWKTEHDADLNALGKRALAESNQAKRTQLLQQIQRRLYDYGPWAVFLQPGQYLGMRNNVDGVYSPYVTIELETITKR